MLTIRFTRTGTIKKPNYRIIVVEKGRDPWGEYNDCIGNYDPKTKKTVIDAEKALAWIAKGAQPSPSVKNLLITKGILKTAKVRASKSLPGKKKSAAIAAKAKAEAVKA